MLLYFKLKYIILINITNNIAAGRAQIIKYYANVSNQSESGILNVIYLGISLITWQMSSELSPEVRNQLQKLAEKDVFAESLDDFVKAGFDILCGTGAEYNEQTCPTALLLAFSHCYCNNLPLSSLATQFPESIRNKFLKAIQDHENQLPQTFKQQGIEQLIDVEWNIDISLGRELWNIILKFESGQQLKLILNYEQLSVLVFKLGQVVAYAQNYQP